MAPTSIEKDFLVGQWSVPLEQDPLSFGFLSQPVLAATDPLAQLGAAAEPLNLPLAEVSASGLDWARIDAAVASLNGQHGSAVFQGSTDLDLADYSTLVDLDQLTGLTVVDEPHLLPSTLLEANPPPLLWDAFNSDQLLVRKGSGDIDLLAGLEALRLGDGDDAIVLLHGQPDQLWIDTGAGVDTATVHASEAPLIDQWRGLEQLRWQAVDGAGVPLAPSANWELTTVLFWTRISPSAWRCRICSLWMGSWCLCSSSRSPRGRLIGWQWSSAAPMPPWLNGW